MSTVFESAISDFLEKNGVGNGAGTARAREIAPLGLNAQNAAHLVEAEGLRWTAFCGAKKFSAVISVA